MIRTSLWIMGIAIVASLFTGTRAVAVVIAEDDGSGAAYADGWAVGDDGGTGFGAWAGNGSYGAVPTMEIDIDASEPDNNLGTPSAFRIGTGGIQGGFFIERTFETPMQAGQRFTIDVDAYSITPPNEPGRDELIGFNSAAGERFALYAYRYDDIDPMNPATFGTDFWGINATTANNNLAGGASLPEDPLGGIVWQTNYSTTDSSDGFSLTLELPTIDTYHLIVVDDGITKLDISGQLNSGATAGQGLNKIYFYGSETTPLSTEPGGVLYFDNMKIETPDGLAGDFDSDGDVDGRDFLIWQRGNSPNPLSPDDLADWQDNYGAPGLAAVAVPEASIACLSSIGLLCWFGLARRNKQ